MQDLCIDGTYIKAHRSSAGVKKGLRDMMIISISESAKGGRSTKIHAVVDGLGYPLVLELTSGQVHDGIMLQDCLEQLDISGSTVLADKAYGSWENREYTLTMTLISVFRQSRIQLIRGSPISITTKKGILLNAFS